MIVVIQSSIFMNFSIPYLRGEGLFFIGYLVVAAIQMGANVDYAIVITNRYLALRGGELDDKSALVQALDEAFATVLTSGTMMASAGMVLQFFTTDGTIATLGECVGRGTMISMVLVLLVLPQILYLCTPLIDRTSFQRKKEPETLVEEEGGYLVSMGRIRGYVEGYVDARVYGTILGKVETKGDARELWENEREEETHEVKK